MPDRRLSETPVRIGPYRATLVGSMLRRIEYDEGGEDARGVGLVIRDTEWRTEDPLRLRRTLAPDSLAVSGRTRLGESALRWRVVWHADRGSLTAEATLVAEGPVQINRAGLVLLLPTARYSDARVTVLHTGGGRTATVLPTAIAAHQPMHDVSGLEIRLRDEGEVQIDFEGEVFEAEDQRNWLDPSFKIYSRPLAAPAPYLLRDGERVMHRIRITRVRAPVRHAATRPPPRHGVLPRLGLALAPGGARVDEPTRAALREIQPAFLLQRVTAARDAADAAALALALGTSLRLEFIAADASLVDACADAMGQHAALVETFAVHRHVGEALARAAKRFPSAAVQGGTFGDFVHLHRDGVAPDAARAVFALCPTVHANDDQSLVESLESLPDVFAQAHTVAASRPLDAGPCALRRRLMPRSAAPDSPDAFGRPRDVDPRQTSSIAGAWLACVVAEAAAGRVEALCTFEAAGPRGLVSGRTANSKACRTPAFGVLQALAQDSAREVEVVGLDVHHGAAFVVRGLEEWLWLVDLSGVRRTLPGPPLRWTILTPARAGAQWRTQATTARARVLGPYGLARAPLRTGRAALLAAGRAWIVRSTRGPMNAQDTNR